MTIYELPSLIALLFKLVLLTYAARSNIKNSLARVFLVLLIALSLFNLVEFGGLSYYADHGFNQDIANALGFTYVALLIPTLALLLHLSLVLSFDQSSLEQRGLIKLLYVPVIPLECLLLFTDKLILGFKPFLYTILRDPGSWYFLFESYAVLYLGAGVVNLIYGARRSRATLARTRNRLWLLGLAPMALLFIYLIVANHF